MLTNTEGRYDFGALFPLSRNGVSNTISSSSLVYMNILLDDQQPEVGSLSEPRRLSEMKLPS